ncbi:aldehyde dehydrogenase family protein, partial [Nocardia salmonicida]
MIDGQLVEAEQTFASLNPATGEVYGYAPEATLEQTEAAIVAARRAFDTTTWSTDAAFRAHCLGQLHRALLDNVEDLRELTIAEVGATRR